MSSTRDLSKLINTNSQLSFTTGYDEKIALYTDNSDNSDWNYISFFSRDESKRTYIGMDNAGNARFMDIAHNEYIAAESDGWMITGSQKTNYNWPTVKPTLHMPFHLSKSIDSKVWYMRSGGNSPTGPSLASYVGPDGYIAYAKPNEPRFTHDPITGECLGLLMEKATTNWLASGNMRGWSVGTSGDSLDIDTSMINPDGTPGVIKAYQGTNIGYHRPHRGVTIPNASGTYAVSVWVKKLGSASTARYVEIEVSGNFANHGAVTFDLDTATHQINTNNLNIVNVIMEPYPNGWYRIGFGLSNPGQTSGTVWFGNPHSMGNDNDVAGTGEYTHAFFGAQFEDFTYSGGDGFVTSYVPTFGIETQTRGQDIINIHNLDGILKPGEYTHTIAFDFIVKKHPPAGQTNFGIWYVNGNDNMYALFRLDNGGPGSWVHQHYTGSSYIGASYSATHNVGQEYRVAARFKSGDNATVEDGNVVSTDGNTINPSFETWESANIGGSGQYMGYGILRSFSVYNTGLTNSEMQAITNQGKL